MVFHMLLNYGDYYFPFWGFLSLWHGDDFYMGHGLKKNSCVILDRIKSQDSTKMTRHHRTHPHPSAQPVAPSVHPSSKSCSQTSGARGEEYPLWDRVPRRTVKKEEGVSGRNERWSHQSYWEMGTGFGKMRSCWLARGIVETETRVNVPGRGMDGGNINTCYEGSVLKTNRKAM